jgi:Uma2 family endonuclease
LLELALRDSPQWNVTTGVASAGGQESRAPHGTLDEGSVSEQAIGKPMALAHHQSSGMMTRAEYETLVRRGVLDEARVELLYGRLVSMSPIGGPHVYCVRHLAQILVTALLDRANVDVQAPFAAPDESEPQPDVMVAPLGDYLDAPPSTALLIVEVAESSLARDRAKSRLYATAGVADFWIVNLPEGVIEVHREPRAGSYGVVTRHGRGDTLWLVSFPEVQVHVSDVLPPADR